jgi:hypothetical protein
MSHRLLQPSTMGWVAATHVDAAPGVVFPYLGAMRRTSECDSPMASRNLTHTFGEVTQACEEEAFPAWFMDADTFRISDRAPLDKSPKEEDMSLLNTIAHEGAPSARRLSITAIVVTTAIAVALAAVGVTIFELAAPETPRVAPEALRGMASEQFIRLNTVDLPELGVVESHTAVTGVQPDEFLRLNTTALPEVVGSQASASSWLNGDGFFRLNTTDLLEVSTPTRAGPASGPR